MTVSAEHAVCQTSVDDIAPVAVAVDLDPIFPTVASCPINGDYMGGEVHPIPNCIPPSVLVPRLAGEPLRLDVTYPAHPRGAGFDWPPESVLPTNGRGGRIPLLHAWDRFAESVDSTWNWSDGATPAPQVRVVDALAAAFAELAEYGEPAAISETPVLVVPNRLASAEQQVLIDAVRAQGRDVRLLWRPVAAASYWCAKHANACGTRAGRRYLLAVHMGFDEWEATVLELVRNERGNLIPARARPDYGAARDCMYGRYLVDQLLLTLFRPETIAARWHNCWCSPAVPNLLRLLGQHSSKEAQTPVAKAFHDLLRKLAGRGWDTEEWLWGDRGTWQGPRLQAWRQRLQAAVVEKDVIGAVVTGPVAGLVGVDGTALGLSEIRRVTRADAVVVESPGDGALARGAVRCAAMMARREVAYLDTLPRIRLLIRRKGEPFWADLLEAEDAYAAGGKLWHRQRDFSLAIAAPATESARRASPGAESTGGPKLTIVVHHDEHPTVRKLEVSDLPPSQKKEPVLLDISIEPAQGNAKVELLPLDPNYLRGRHVVFRWEKANETGSDPDQYVIKEMPRFFPGLNPRTASPAKWRAARERIESMLTRPTLNLADMKDLHDLVMQKDTTQGRQDITAVSSDGRPPEGFDVLQELVGRLTTALAKPRIRMELREEIVRVLAYVSADHPQLHAYLARCLDEMAMVNAPSNAEAVIVAGGQCFRTPDKAALVLQRCVGRWVRHRELPEEWIKAAARLLKYRENASEAFPSDEAYMLMDACYFRAHQELQHKRAQAVFMASVAVVVFLLRRRAFDEGFLDPDDSRAQQVKALFRTAIAELRAGRLRTFVGGAVDLPSLLQTMIDYIDKRGAGNIPIAL